MSRINVRYYKAHPPIRYKEIDPVAYIIWSSMTPQQREAFARWSTDMTTALYNFAVKINEALFELWLDIVDMVNRRGNSE